MKKLNQEQKKKKKQNQSKNLKEIEFHIYIVSQ